MITTNFFCFTELYVMFYFFDIILSDRLNLKKSVAYICTFTVLYCNFAGYVNSRIIQRSFTLTIVFCVCLGHHNGSLFGPKVENSIVS